MLGTGNAAHFAKTSPRSLFTSLPLSGGHRPPCATPIGQRTNDIAAVCVSHGTTGNGDLRMQKSLRVSMYSEHPAWEIGLGYPDVIDRRR
jgi:hypothetical protein